MNEFLPVFSLLVSLAPFVVFCAALQGFLFPVSKETFTLQILFSPVTHIGELNVVTDGSN